MTDDDLRTRIAQALRPFLRWDGPPPHELADRLADALIAELKLTKQIEEYAMPDSTRHRFVTPWKEDR